MSAYDYEDCDLCGGQHLRFQACPDYDPEVDEWTEECPGCGGTTRCHCSELEDDSDFGPPDSDYGDSESDHVWADLARSEAW